MPGRRELSFDRLDQVMSEVDRLVAGGHSTVGRWSLAEILQHLASTLRMTIEPPPGQKPPPWLIRKTIGPLVLRRILKSGRMPEGLKGPAALMPRPGTDARDEAQQLRAAIRLFLDCFPESYDHPFFGRVSRPNFTRLQCIHCAHHLSFVLPAGGGTGGPPHAARIEPEIARGA